MNEDYMKGFKAGIEFTRKNIIGYINTMSNDINDLEKLFNEFKDKGEK